MTEASKILLSILRLAAGGDLADFPRRDSYPWGEIFDLTVEHGISALAWDGLQRLYDEGIFTGGEIPHEIMDDWTSWIMSTEQDWRIMKTQADSLARFYAKSGISMMVLKGYSSSLDWPVPEHRTFGDLDIWLFGKCREADRLLKQKKNISVNRSHRHHTVFMLRDRIVENHYDFITVSSHYSNWAYEKKLKSLATLEKAVPHGHFYIPAPNLEVMFNLRHMALHFASVRCTLRHLIDWAFTVRRHHSEIDWKMVVEASDKAGMLRFMSAIDAICIKYLGFEKEIFPDLPLDEELADRVLEDMLSPEFQENPSGRLLPDILFKFRRWRAGAWKQKIVFRESLVITFVLQLFSHLFKPSSFRE